MIFIKVWSNFDLSEKICRIYESNMQAQGQGQNQRPLDLIFFNFVSAQYIFWIEPWYLWFPHSDPQPFCVWGGDQCITFRLFLFTKICYLLTSAWCPFELDLAWQIDIHLLSDHLILFPLAVGSRHFIPIHSLSNGETFAHPPPPHTHTYCLLPFAAA